MFADSTGTGYLPRSTPAGGSHQSGLRRVPFVPLLIALLVIPFARPAVAQSDPPVITQPSPPSPGPDNTPLIRIQPRPERGRPAEGTAQLPRIIPAPRPYEPVGTGKVRNVQNPTAERNTLAGDIQRRSTMQLQFSRTVIASLASRDDTTFQYVNPSNVTGREIPYDSRLSETDQLSELTFGAPWQFPFKVHEGTIRFPLSASSFNAVYRFDQIDHICDDIRDYNLHLTGQSLLHAYSGRDNLFQRDTGLRLQRNVPKPLLERMNSSEIDERLIELPRVNEHNGPCEIGTILWLSGLLDQIGAAADRPSARDEKIEILVCHSQPTQVYQEGLYYYIYSQCFFTAIRSTLEPDVIHVCLVEFEMHESQPFFTGMLYSDLRWDRKYQLQRTWSIGTLR